MKVELNVRTLVVCGVVLAGLIGGSVYVGNYFFQKHQDKKMEDSLMRAVYGGTKEELAAQEDCIKRRDSEIIRKAEEKRSQLKEEIDKKIAMLNRESPDFIKKTDEIVDKFIIKSSKLDDVVVNHIAKPEILITEGIVKLDSEYDCQVK